MGNTRTIHKQTSALEDCGFWVKDQLFWAYNDGMNKSHWVRNLEWEGWKSPKLKPMYEPISWLMKPFDGKLIENLEKYKVGAVNINATRIPFRDQKQMMEYFSNCIRGIYKDGEDRGAFGGGWKSQNETMRKLFLDDPRIGTDFISNKDKGNISTRSKDQVFGENFYKKHVMMYKLGGRESGNRIRLGFYFDGLDKYLTIKDYEQELTYPKPTKKERNKGLEKFPNVENTADWFKGKWHVDKRVPEGGYYVKPKPTKNIHKTVKPINLGIHLILLTTKPEQTVLDLFCGSGSFLISALLINREFIGIEKEKKFYEIAKHRLMSYNKQSTLE